MNRRSALLLALAHARGTQTFLEISKIARESLMLLESNMVAAQLFYRDYQLEYKPGLARNSTISIRRPTTGNVSEYNGSTEVLSEINETGIDLTLEKHFDASIKVTSREMTLSITDFSEQVLKPHLLAMAEKIDIYALSKVARVPNYTPNAAPGALPTTIGHVASIREVANTLKMPMTNRRVIAAPQLETALLSIDSFVTADKIGDAGTAIREASLGRKMGIDWYMDQNFNDATFTTGTQVTGAVNGVHAIGATTLSLNTLSVATGTIKAGDIIVISGYGEKVCAAALMTAVANAGVVTLTEPLRFALAGAEAVTVYDGGGNTSQDVGVLFHPNAFALAAVPLALPHGAAAADYVQDRGFGIRAVYGYDRALKSDILSLDILVGCQMIDGRLAARIKKNI
jgi:hypothetical protein